MTIKTIKDRLVPQTQPKSALSPVIRPCPSCGFTPPVSQQSAGTPRPYLLRFAGPPGVTGTTRWVSDEVLLLTCMFIRTLPFKHFAHCAALHFVLLTFIPLLPLTLSFLFVFRIFLHVSSINYVFPVTFPNTPQLLERSLIISKQDSVQIIPKKLSHWSSSCLIFPLTILPFTIPPRDQVNPPQFPSEPQALLQLSHQTP